MTRLTLKIETTNQIIVNEEDAINRISYAERDNKEHMVLMLQKYFNSRYLLHDDGFKFGFGGSHVWCSNSKNERQFIIEIHS